MDDLARLRALPRDEQSAFLALFAGGRTGFSLFRRGDTGEEMRPSFGKAECEWVPFRPFWQEKMPSYGWTTFAESDPAPALGMVEGSTFTKIKIGVTDAGWNVRESYWHNLRCKLAEQDAV